MKKILSFTILSSLIFLFSGCGQKEKSAAEQEKQKEEKPAAVAVQVQSAAQSKNFSQQLSYPAIVAYDQEVTVAAKSAGTITALNFDLGKKVFTGQKLVTIDDTGNNLSASEDSRLKSSQIQQLESAVEQAKESLGLAKRNHKDTPTKQTKTAEDIAELQYEDAKRALQSALDSHLVTAPISGTITSRSVSLGDSVNLGQTIATISKTDKIKLKFYVAAQEVDRFKTNMQLDVIDNDKENFTAIITNISTAADPESKRFLIEATPSQKDLLSGKVLTIVASLNDTVTKSENLIVPLAAITIDQNENYIFIAQGTQAKKVTVDIATIKGETAEISANLPLDAQIIVQGNKLLQDGSTLTIIN